MVLSRLLTLIKALIPLTQVASPEEESLRVEERKKKRKPLMLSLARRKSPMRKGGKELPKGPWADICEQIDPRFLEKVDIFTIAATPLEKASNSRAIATLMGPGDSTCSLVTYEGLASGQAISNYPLIANRPYREGDPICDRFMVRLYRDYTFIALADGCNWGHMSRKAAKRATKRLLETIEEFEEVTKDCRTAAAVLLLGFSRGHERILDFGRDQLGPGPGKTTLVGGLLLHNVEKEADAPYTFVFTTLGDCKFMHFDRTTGTVRDITSGNRLNILDARDAGGRLGGSHERTDIRNLSIGSVLVQEGDMIIALSDGVHDNFDPQACGISPRELGMEADTWEQAPYDLALQAKTTFMEQRIMENLRSLPTSFTPEHVVARLIETSETITSPSRRFMEEFPSDKLPPDLRKYPGKLDHASCACIVASLHQETIADFSSNCFFDTSQTAMRHAVLRERQLSYALELEAATPSKLQAKGPPMKRRETTAHRCLHSPQQAERPISLRDSL